MKRLHWWYHGVMILSLFIFSFCFFHLYRLGKEQKNSKKLYQDLSHLRQEEETNTSDEELLSVNFDFLIKTNPEIVAWLKVNGTQIDYPVVQTTDNEYYLSHGIDQSITQEGAIFLDYRNNISSFDKNSVIYGHRRLDQTMFGSLKNILKSPWYENQDHWRIYLTTKKEKTLWQVMSVYTIKKETNYIQTHFKDEIEYEKFLNLILSRSIYNFSTPISVHDRILTLSTCLNNYGGRIVLHAKLIKKETNDT